MPMASIIALDKSKPRCSECISCNSAFSAVVEVRAGHQRADRQDAWHHSAAIVARHRRRGDRVRRREFISLLGGVASWPLAAGAQQAERVPKVGILSAFAESDPETQRNVAAFRQALEKRGWNDGHNIRIDYRWGGADPERIRTQASELVSLMPDVILVSSGLALQPLRQQTSTIPIVFTQIADAVSAGFVTSLARPGGNVTDFTVAESTLYGKLLELLKEAAPQVTRVAVIFNPDQIPQAGMLHAIEAAATPLKVQLTMAGVRNVAEAENAVDQFARAANGGLIVLPNPITIGNRQLIIAMAARHRLPAAYAFRVFVADGGLISYGVDMPEQYRQAAGYVDRILHGEKPADLPVQQPTKFELAINVKTAKGLSLQIPDKLIALADEVIE
jgi:putative ABC transport system substrate-binding protein